MAPPTGQLHSPSTCTSRTPSDSSQRRIFSLSSAVAAGVIPSGADAQAYVDGLRASAESVRPGPGPVPAATAEETEKVLRWLEAPGVRLVEVDGEWTCPVAGATRHLAVHDAVHQSKLSLVPFGERRDLSPVHQPVR